MPGLFRTRVVFYVFLLLAGEGGSAWPCGGQAQPNLQQLSASAYQRGMKLLQDHRYPQALEQFKEVEQISPRLSLGFTGEGIALALSGQLEDAVAVLKKALQIDPTDWVARRELGIVEWQLKRKTEAAQELTPLSKLFPEDSAVNLILGQINFENKNYVLANEFFLKVPAQVAADFRLSLMAADAQIKTGHSQDAAADLRSLCLTPDLTPRMKFQIALLLGDAGDYPRALELFDSLPQDFDDPFGRGYGTALAYFGENRYGECVKLLTKLKGQGIMRAELFTLLGVAEEKAGHTVESYDAFREGIYQFPRVDENYLDIATLAVEHLNYDLAIEVLASGIRQIPDDYKMFLTRGVVLALRNDLNSAQDDLQKAYTLAPTEPSVYVALGICLMDQDKFEQAATVLRRGVQEGLKDVRIYFFLADALFRQGITASSPAYQETLDAVEASVNLDPGFADGYLQRGRLKLISNQIEGAIADFQQARKLAPEERPILYQLATTYRMTGRKDEAEKLFAEVSEAVRKEDVKYSHDQLIQTIVDVSKVEQTIR